VQELMNRRDAFVHPSALGLLASAVILLVATFVAPALRSWSDRSVWILLWGVLAYAAAVFVILRSRPGPPSVSSSELRQLRAIRQAISTLIGESEAVEASQLGGVLAQAVERIDFDIEPALQELVHRHRMLSRDLSRYEQRELPLPDAGVMNRLWAIHARQRAAIDECIQQAANAQAALVALLREGDSSVMAARAREWVDDLLTLHDSLDEVLRGGDALESVVSVEKTRYGSDHETVVADNFAGSAVPTRNGHSVGRHEPDVLAPYSPAEPHVAQTPPVVQISEETLVRLVEETLRRLQNPGALANCELIQILPLTLTAASPDANLDQTPLERGRALRKVLDTAIEGLADPAGATALQHDIIHEEYQVGRSNKEIVARHHISESTLHRYRRDAILVLARELKHQEERLALRGSRISESYAASR